MGCERVFFLLVRFRKQKRYMAWAVRREGSTTRLEPSQHEDLVILR